MTNLIWTMVGVYFLTGVLLLIKAHIKAMILTMNLLKDDSYGSRTFEAGAELLKERLEVPDSVAMIVVKNLATELKVIAMWPLYMQDFEEGMLDGVKLAFVKKERS